MPTLDLHSAASVPESHSWSDLNNLPSAADSTGANAIPVIDLADPDVLRLISLAWESWGGFQLTGHGVPDVVLENFDSESRRLFALPIEEKMKIARAAGSMEGYGTVLLQSFFAKQFWMEGFSVKSNAKTHQFASKLWSDDSRFCKVVEEYRKEMNSVSTKLVEMMLLSLGLTEADIKQADPIGISQKDPDHMIQMNWYPTCPEPERAMGMSPHTDSPILTVLYQGVNTTGLQLLKNEDQHGPARWVTVPVVPDSLIILIGDLGHILSNGRFHSPMHRVMVNHAEARLCVIYFWSPPDDVTVSPLVGGLTNKPVYRAVTLREYLAVKFKTLYKALDSIKLGEAEEEKKVLAVEEEKKDDFAAEVKEEDDFAAEVEEEKKVEVDQEKKVLDVEGEIKVPEKKDGSNAEVEEKKKDVFASEVKEEKKDGSITKIEEEKEPEKGVSK